MVFLKELAYSNNLYINIYHGKPMNGYTLWDDYASMSKALTVLLLAFSPTAITDRFTREIHGVLKGIVRH